MQFPGPRSQVIGRMSQIRGILQVAGLSLGDPASQFPDRRSGPRLQISDRRFRSVVRFQVPGPDSSHMPEVAGPNGSGLRSHVANHRLAGRSQVLGHRS